MRKQGFTLAEVLITLGIIGVVAAMTIPTLISNTTGAQFKTAYKKSLSVLNQAVLLNLALEETDLSSLVADGEAKTKDDLPAGSMGKILTTRTMGEYVQTLYDEDFTTQANSPLKGAEKADAAALTKDKIHTISFPDGTSFSYDKAITDCVKTTADGSDTYNCIGFIDVNGKKGPNKEITCSNGGVDEDNCYVTNETIGNGDIYPVYLFGQQIIPATEAARAVLFGNDKAQADDKNS